MSWIDTDSIAEARTAINEIKQCGPIPGENQAVVAAIDRAARKAMLAFRLAINEVTKESDSALDNEPYIRDLAELIDDCRELIK